MKKRLKEIRQSKASPHKQVIQSESSENFPIVWAFNMIDKNSICAFCPDKHNDFHNDVYNAIMNFSTMTWADIKAAKHGKRGGSNNHQITKDNLTEFGLKLAMQHGFFISDNERAENIAKEEALFSLRFGGTKRIIGIRNKRVFHVIWYDENHQIVKSGKRNT